MNQIFTKMYKGNKPGKIAADFMPSLTTPKGSARWTFT
jgi:hypothetical protein